MSDDRLTDRMFFSFLKLLAKIIRLFIPKPQLGFIDTKRSDSLKEKRHE